MQFYDCLELIRIMCIVFGLRKLSRIREVGLNEMNKLFSRDRDNSPEVVSVEDFPLGIQSFFTATIFSCNASHRSTNMRSRSVSKPQLIQEKCASDKLILQINLQIKLSSGIINLQSYLFWTVFSCFWYWTKSRFYSRFRRCLPK